MLRSFGRAPFFNLRKLSQTRKMYRLDNNILLGIILSIIFLNSESSHFISTVNCSLWTRAAE